VRAKVLPVLAVWEEFDTLFPQVFGFIRAAGFWKSLDPEEKLPKLAGPDKSHTYSKGYLSDCYGVFPYVKTWMKRMERGRVETHGPIPGNHPMEASHVELSGLI
jgi:hypothetical protein